MPYRHYTDQQKQQVLELLRANGGDVIQTVSQTTIDQRTLARWARQAGIQPPMVSLVRSATTTTQPSDIHTLAESVLLDDLYEIRSDVITLCKHFIVEIPTAIQQSPLNQQVTSLCQLIDRALKLATELPQPPEEIDYEGYLPPLEQPTPEEAGPASAASQPTANSAE